MSNARRYYALCRDEHSPSPTSLSSPKLDRFSSSQGRKKKNSDYPPQQRGNSGSNFANDDLEDGGPTPWEDLDDPSSPFGPRRWTRLSL
ncbi:hypothetical protein HYDPIDRAFT_25056 [Hydnomerulius pinastri MD-312]|nr:hypothetical protein HYDPIDRAFT_25056 [Hydnomerulius pinastri MD-312]